MLALVAQVVLELTQLDLKVTFLHSGLEEEIYVTQPDEFKFPGKSVGQNNDNINRKLEIITQ